MDKILAEIIAKVKQYNITPDRILQAIAYLKHYGYLVETKELTLQDVIDAVKQFNEFFQLENHGDIITPKVLRAMQAPRCSLPDIRRENISGTPAWGIDYLTYFIQKRVDGLDGSVFDNCVAQAFQNWTDVADVHFTRVNDQNSANLVISQGTGASNQFDGPGGVLAWAQLPAMPAFKGQLLMEFDDSETWTTDPAARGILVVNVASHEFGHLLGLEHSKVAGALMAPFYSAAVSKPQQNDDIPRIQAFFGPPQTSVPTPSPVPSPSPSPSPTPTPAGNKLVLEISGDNLKFSLPGYRIMKT